MLKKLIAGEEAAEGGAMHYLHLFLKLFLSVPKT